MSPVDESRSKAPPGLHRWLGVVPSANFRTTLPDFIATGTPPAGILYTSPMSFYYTARPRTMLRGLRHRQTPLQYQIGPGQITTV